LIVGKLNMLCSCFFLLQKNVYAFDVPLNNSTIIEINPDILVDHVYNCKSFLMP